jgi:acyl-CoA hydrolase
MANYLSEKRIVRAPVDTNCATFSYHITRLRVPLFEVDLGNQIHSRIIWNRRRSLAVSQLIFREGESGFRGLTTQATLTMVCVRFSGRPALLPEDFCGPVSQYARSTVLQ